MRTNITDTEELNKIVLMTIQCDGELTPTKYVNNLHSLQIQHGCQQSRIKHQDNMDSFTSRPNTIPIMKITLTLSQR